MSILTGHWSASDPVRLKDYHVEFAQRGTLAPAMLEKCRSAKTAQDVPWIALKLSFDVWKNTNFDTPTSYGTWDWNHDFRDGSPNIEIAAMCMAEASISDFGSYPYTKAHAWMHAAIMARIAHLKGIDPLASFDPVQGYFDGPIFALSTHGERAYQTVNSSVETADRGYTGYRGYGMYSADPDSRWDIAVVDVLNKAALSSYETAYPSVKSSAAWLRASAAQIIHLNLIADMWGLDQEVPR